jgi:cytochrome c biogenesis protein CcmG, thiol:disulfide interchange protein DsbE
LIVDSILALVKWFILDHAVAVRYVLLILGVAWIGLTAVLAPPTSGSRPPAPRQGFSAPDFSLRTIDDRMIQLSSLKGHPVIVNIWASWCGPCQAEMPLFEELYSRYHSQGLEILAVNSTFQDSLLNAKAFIQERNLTFPVLLDTQGQVTRQYQVQALPTTFFIDEQGVVHNQVIGGPLTSAMLESEINNLLLGGK